MLCQCTGSAISTLGNDPLGTLDVLGIHIAECCHPHIVVIEKGPHITRALRANANDAERDLVRRRGL
jgi:hypothetical protein